MAKKTILDLSDLAGKRALVRVDFNVPLKADGGIESDRRIRAALPTLHVILQAGGSAVLMSHLGRPKGGPDKNPHLRMDRVAQRLGELLGRPVRKANQVVGPEATAAAQALKPGEVLLLENLRFDEREQKADEGLAGELAALGDYYVNDAFGTCQNDTDTSMFTVPKVMKEQGKHRVIGLLVAKEMNILDTLLSNPKRPLLGILGGAKVSDKINFIKALLKRVDRVLIGGAMSYTFLKAEGVEVGASRVENDKLDLARELLQLGAGKIELPVDHLVVEKLDAAAPTKVVEGAIPPGWVGVDIGPKTIARYCEAIRDAATAVWNGPMGKFEDEPFSRGTRAAAEALASSSAITIVGGGETADAVEKYGLDGKMTHVSTGGGAFLKYVEGASFATLGLIEDK